MYRVFLLIFLLAAVNFTSQARFSDRPVRSDAGEVIKMRVQGHKVNCQPDGSEQCYSVQKGATIGMETWEVLPQSIEGFTFEEGYTYDLIVRVDLQQGKTGTERFKYILVEIISKIKES